MAATLARGLDVQASIADVLKNTRLLASAARGRRVAPEDAFINVVACACENASLGHGLAQYA